MTYQTALFFSCTRSQEYQYLFQNLTYFDLLCKHKCEFMVIPLDLSCDMKLGPVNCNQGFNYYKWEICAKYVSSLCINALLFWLMAVSFWLIRGCVLICTCMHVRKRGIFTFLLLIIYILWDFIKLKISQEEQSHSVFFMRHFHMPALWPMLFIYLNIFINLNWFSSLVF